MDVEQEHVADDVIELIVGKKYKLRNHPSSNSSLVEMQRVFIRNRVIQSWGYEIRYLNSPFDTSWRTITGRKFQCGENSDYDLIEVVS